MFTPPIAVSKATSAALAVPAVTDVLVPPTPLNVVFVPALSGVMMSGASSTIAVLVTC